VDRRRFVESGTLALAGILVGCAPRFTTIVTPDHGRVRLLLRNHPELSRPGGGAIRILPEGAAGPLYVVMLESGEALTVSPVCKHLGCIVELNAQEFVCPCHGSRYARNGAVRKGPTQLPLDRFPTRMTEDGVIEIDLRMSS